MLAITYGRPQTRKAAAALAADLGDATLLADAAMLDEATSLRMHAVGLLLKLKAQPGLHHAGLSDPEVSVRLATVDALIKLGAADSLLAALDDPTLEVRTAAWKSNLP